MCSTQRVLLAWLQREGVERASQAAATVLKKDLSVVKPVNGAGPCDPEIGWAASHNLTIHILQRGLIGGIKPFSIRKSISQEMKS